jgi:hypothetical protein
MTGACSDVDCRQTYDQRRWPLQILRELNLLGIRSLDGEVADSLAEEGECLDSVLQFLIAE